MALSTLWIVDIPKHHVLFILSLFLNFEVIYLSVTNMASGYVIFYNSAQVSDTHGIVFFMYCSPRPNAACFLIYRCF